MAEPLGIGMLGTSHAHAAGKMEVLRRSASWRVLGACEPDTTALAANRVAPAFRSLPWLSQEELLSHPEIAAVAVEGDVAENPGLGRAVIAAGKHLHLEKPAGTDLAGPTELFRQAEAQGLVVQLGYMFRYNPAFRFVFEAKERGWLGDVFAVRGRMSTNIPPERRPPMGRFAGGMMFELGCHLLDAVVRLLGPPVEVTGFCRHDLPFEDGLADNTLAVFSYDRAVAMLETAAMESDPFPQRRFEVYGTEGSVVIQPLEPPAASASFRKPPEGHPAGWHEVPVPAYQRYVDDFEELAQCVGEGRPLSYAPAHDLAVQKALLQACGVG